MKIKYEFADGTVSEVEVEESIGAVIIEDRRLEDNLARKERYHCHSLDAVEFEGMEYGTEETPETLLDAMEDDRRVYPLPAARQTGREARYGASSRMKNTKGMPFCRRCTRWISSPKRKRSTKAKSRSIMWNTTTMPS